MRCTRVLSRGLGPVMAVTVFLCACADDASPADPTSASSGTGDTGGAGSGGDGGGPTCEPGSHAAPDGGCEATLAEWTAGPSLAQKRDHHLTFVASSATTQPAVATARSDKSPRFRDRAPNRERDMN